MANQFTGKQIEGLSNTVDLYHSRFILENVGIEVLTKQERAMLQEDGVDLSKYKGKRTSVDESYLFGKIESSVRNRKVLNRLDLKQFRKFLDENPDLTKLSKEDRANIKLAKEEMANDIRRLANDIKHDFQQKIHEINRSITKTDSKKKILSTISTSLAENTKKYSGRFELISGYRMHSSFQSGIAAEILQRLGPNAKVYFSVHPDACEKCIKLYLRNGRGSQPKIFLLKTILKNGSNIGKKATDLKPSMYPVHPRCRCKMNMLPKGKIKWSSRQNHYIREF